MREHRAASGRGTLADFARACDASGVWHVTSLAPTTAVPPTPPPTTIATPTRQSDLRPFDIAGIWQLHRQLRGHHAPVRKQLEHGSGADHVRPRQRTMDKGNPRKRVRIPRVALRRSKPHDRERLDSCVSVASRHPSELHDGGTTRRIRRVLLQPCDLFRLAVGHGSGWNGLLLQLLAVRRATHANTAHRASRSAIQLSASRRVRKHGQRSSSSRRHP